ncbi:MAG: flagellar biosynthesis anti-sigma factor FlgM, partial [candidate division KSB1 bacterium]|nr:flagellar biosynthesis anti-sigma factor FlgM [candidate division KSB1 bacterium]
VKNHSENEELIPSKKKNISSNDDVVLSTRSKEMQKIYEILKEIPDIRGEKVSTLKKSIQEGRYSVNPQILAEKMLAEFFLDHIL